MSENELAGEIPVPEQQEEKDNNGNVVTPYKPAGNRYGIRYDELLAFILVAN